MKGFIPLLRKEIQEQLKLYRLVIVGGIFVFFGISDPIMLKYLPEILKMAGSGQMVIQLPTTTAAQSLAVSMTFLVSMILGSLFCFGYTVWLIHGSVVMPFIGLNLLLGLFLVFCLAVTLFFSSMYKSGLAAGGLAIGVVIVQAIISSIPIIGNFMPGKLLSWGTDLLTGTGTGYWWALGITVVAIGLCLYFAQRFLKNRDL